MIHRTEFRASPKYHDPEQPLVVGPLHWDDKVVNHRRGIPLPTPYFNYVRMWQDSWHMYLRVQRNVEAKR